MKILSIGPASPHRGGIAKFNESFALACLSKGHQVEIISYSFLYPSFLFPGKTQFSSDPPPPGLKITPLIHSFNPLSWGKTARQIIKIKPDLVVIHYWMPFFAPSLGSISKIIRRQNNHVAAIAHNLFPHEKQPGVKILTRYFLKHLDSFVALSDSVLQDFLAFGLNIPAIRIPHPVYNIYGGKPSRDESVKHLGLDPGTRYLLFFGLIRKYKGLELLIDAFSRVKVKNLKLIVAGEFYDEKTKYITLARRTGVEDRLIITDSFIPDNEVKYYFSAAETVVQPYLSATQSGVTQIAYHYDVPMVVTNVGGLPEIVFDGVTGFVCKRDSDELASAIEKTLEPVTRIKLLEGIKREKHRFSWDNFVEELISNAAVNDD